MNHDDLQFTLKNAVSLKLLQSPHAPLILSFLYRQFKQAHRVAIPLPELVEQLEDYLETLSEAEPKRYLGSAQKYLNTWCDDDHQYLRKYYESTNDDPVFELTPDTERAIGWLEDLSQRAFIGTESRFLRIFDLLSEIVVKSTEDPEARLAQLEQEKAAIQREIDEIQQTGEVERYTDTQIKERFFEANDTARRLLADFRAVEQNFRQLTRQIQEQRLKEGIRKGALVAYVIDADEALKESDQGRSFYAFWEFLMSPSKQDELRRLLDKVYALPELIRFEGDSPILRQIKNNLMIAGEKIIQSNQRLAEQLRKILDDQHRVEHQRMLELIEAIKRTSLNLVDEDVETEPLLELEMTPALNLPLERPLWAPTEKPDFKTYDVAVTEHDLQTVDLETLYTQFYVDEHRLLQNINKALTGQNAITLAELIRRYPVQKGLSEIVTYIALASKDEAHDIDEQVQDSIAYHSTVDDAVLHELTLPQVIFRR